MAEVLFFLSKTALSEIRHPAPFGLATNLAAGRAVATVMELSNAPLCADWTGFYGNKQEGRHEKQLPKEKV